MRRRSHYIRHEHECDPDTISAAAISVLELLWSSVIRGFFSDMRHVRLPKQARNGAV